MPTSNATSAMQTVALKPVDNDRPSTLVDKIVANPQLLSPPTLALRIVEKTRQTECSAQEISELLAHDPALCGKLLKTLNSPLYGLSTPVTSLRRAVAILGLKPLRSMVLGLTLPAMHARLEPDQGLRIYWKESVAGAIIARELAKRLNYPFPEDDLVASLLRDLGMVLLRQAFPAIYLPIWNHSAEVPPGSQCDWEVEHLGAHHAEVSAALLRNWSLPAEIVTPVKYHHHPKDLPASTQSQPLLVQRTHLVEFSSRLAQLEEFGRDADLLKGILETGRERFGLERPELEEFLAQVRPRINEFAAILRLDIGTCPNFAEVLAAGCEELIRLSAENATGVNHLRNESAAHGSTNRGLEAPDGESPDSTHAGTRRTRAVGGTSGLFDKLRASGFKGRIQQFVVEGLIGRGAMGIVLKAHDPGLDRAVALKILAPELGECEEAQQRFAQEARFAAAIRHENVVTIFAVNEMDGVPFLVMEYIPGMSLQDILETDEQFTVADIERIGRQTALGLAAAHDLRLIHRDIKPANLLLERQTKRVRITDFGLARAMDRASQLSQNGLLVGTPLFMSPEQVDGLPLTPSSDLFSLGSVLYTLATGVLPFAADTLSGVLHAVALKDPPPACEVNPELPEWLSRAIAKLMAKRPVERFASATAFAECLAARAL